MVAGCGPGLSRKHLHPPRGKIVTGRHDLEMAFLDCGALQGFGVVQNSGRAYRVGPHRVLHLIPGSILSLLHGWLNCLYDAADVPRGLPSGHGRGHRPAFLVPHHHNQPQVQMFRVLDFLFV